MRRLFFTVIMPIVCVGFILFWSTKKIYSYALQSKLFQIHKIEVESMGKLSKEEVLRVAGIPNHENLLALDILALKKKLENEATIHSAFIAKVLPDTLKIQVIPEAPVALLNFGKIFYLNQWGEAFGIVKPGDDLRLPFINLENSKTLKKNLDNENRKHIFSERIKKRIYLAFEIIGWAEHSKWITREKIGDIFIRNERYDGMAPIELTLKLSDNNAEQNNLVERKYTTISFNEEDLPRQLQRLELVLNELMGKKIWPEKIRMELDKKVVVKIAQ